MFILMEVDGGQRKYVADPLLSVSEIKDRLLQASTRNDYYVTRNGKILNDSDSVRDGTIRLVPRLVGGKGGFGSMLRAIGAQIEKTTNREACRDLSGRRLRDINEEKRLKNWIAQQAEREREAAERRKKKLERLCYQPKHDFSDQDYEKKRSELTEKVHDAVEEGFRKAALSSTSGSKRKSTEPGPSQAKKKKTACLWVDADSDELSSSLDSSDSEAEGKTTSKVNEGGETEAKCREKQLGGVEGKELDSKCSDQKTQAKPECEEKACEDGGVEGKELDSKCNDLQTQAKPECEEKACEDTRNDVSDASGTQSDYSDNATDSSNQEEKETEKAIEKNTS